MFGMPPCRVRQRACRTESGGPFALPKLQASDASAAFDNFTKRTYEVPRVGVERALRLSWADTGMNRLAANKLPLELTDELCGRL